MRRQDRQRILRLVHSARRASWLESFARLKVAAGQWQTAFWSEGSTAPWDPPGAEPFAPACLKTAGASPQHICTSGILLRHAAGGSPPAGRVLTLGSFQIFKDSIEPCFWSLRHTKDCMLPSAFCTGHMRLTNKLVAYLLLAAYTIYA